MEYDQYKSYELCRNKLNYTIINYSFWSFSVKKKKRLYYIAVTKVQLLKKWFNKYF